MAFFKSGTLIERFATTATAGTTTTLVYTSPKFQIFTGTLTQNVELPLATTMSNSQEFIIDNSSTGILTVLLNDGTTVLTTLQAGVTKQLKLTSNATSNGTWTVPVPGIVSLNTTSQPKLAGDVTIAQGTGVTVTQSGQTLTISSAGIPNGYPNYFCASESDLATAITSAGAAGGGVICLLNAFNLTSNHTIPVGTTLIGRKGASILNCVLSSPNFGGLTLSDGVKMEDVWMVTTYTSTATMLFLPSNYAVLHSNQFKAPSGSGITCVDVTGNANKMYNNVFIGVVGGSTIGINYAAGIDNADNDTVNLP